MGAASLEKGNLANRLGPPQQFLWQPEALTRQYQLFSFSSRHSTNRSVLSIQYTHGHHWIPCDGNFSSSLFALLMRLLARAESSVATAGTYCRLSTIPSGVRHIWISDLNFVWNACARLQDFDFSTHISTNPQYNNSVECYCSVSKITGAHISSFTHANATINDDPKWKSSVPGTLSRSQSICSDFVERWRRMLCSTDLSQWAHPGLDYSSSSWN
jgi:hypothetical protein